MLKKIFAVLGIALVILLVYFMISPKPTAFLIHKMFEGGVAVKPLNYDEIENNVESFKDISYESKYKKGYLDITKPIEHEGKLPVIFWVHGGAFVGGDKSDITEYAVQVANEGYIVVNLNYELAPQATYPTPLNQLKEAYTFIEQNADEYDIDMESVYFAGDSAGAQIVSQFVNIQVDESYSNMIAMEAVVPSNTIKGMLLFCGPYDISQVSDISDNNIIKFFLNRVGWSYIGDRNWMDSAALKEASIIDNVSEGFPSTFITDGNKLSFEDQGLALAEKLRSLDIVVHDVFYPLDEAELIHEYQFMMDTPQAENTFSKMIEFLDLTSK